MKSLRVRSSILPSPLAYGAEPMSILTMQYKLMLSGKKKKHIKTKNNLKRVTFRTYDS